MLIVFGGLPGAGKTTIARELARQIAAVYLRIDSIEQVIRATGAVDSALNEAGYRVSYVLAGDNLGLGRTVIADCVNPLQTTRDAWVEVAKRAQVRTVEIEVLCSDVREHRRRLESRISDISGLRLPSWEDVAAREYDSWNRERVVIDTAIWRVEESVATIRGVLEKMH